jgi:hypothetical protein
MMLPHRLPGEDDFCILDTVNIPPCQQNGKRWPIPSPALRPEVQEGCDSSKCMGLKKKKKNQNAKVTGTRQIG